MKIHLKLFPNIAPLVAFCSAMALTSVTADQNHGGGSGSDDEHLFEIELSMAPTADAPPGSSARLSFEAENDNGTATAQLQVKADNLPPATYTVAVTLKSDGSSVTLGTFTVDNEGEGEIEFGHDGTPFPTGLDPANISGVTIAAANGVVLFTADLTDLTNAGSMNINVSAAAVAGPGVPNATGNVAINGFVSRGRVKGSLQFIGHGLPANASVVFTVNGTPVKNLHTSKLGDVNVKIGPKGKTGTIIPGVTLAAVTSVAIVDANGNVLLQVNL